MAVGDVYKLSVIGSAGGQSHYNVLHYRVDSQTGVGATVQEMIQEWAAVMQAAYLDCLGAHYTLAGFIMKQILPTPGNPEERPAAGTVVGSIVGDPAPSYQAQVTGLRTNVATRSGRGRVYLGAQIEANSEATDGNKYTAAYLTTVGAFYALYQADLTVTGASGNSTLTPQVYSKKLNTVAEVVQTLVSSRPATMRSRKFRGLVGA